MNYIYDLLLNFNEKIYDFYDWNKNDKIIHIKKIPVFKISSSKMNIIRNNKICFEDSFLEKIYRKTEEFIHKKNKYIDYACLFTDGLEVIGINVNKKITYSRLLIDEEAEVINMSLHMNENDIEIKAFEKKEQVLFKTRKEIDKINETKDMFNKILKEDNDEKLKYLYYECFDKKTDSKEEIIKIFTDQIENRNIIEKINNFYNIKNV